MCALSRVVTLLTPYLHTKLYIDVITQPTLPCLHILTNTLQKTEAAITQQPLDQGHHGNQ